MMHLKMLGLAAAAAAALMTLSGVASATTLTSPTGTASTPAIHAQNEEHIVYHNPIAKIECNSTFQLQVSEHGAGTAAAGNLTNLTFTNCTNSWHMTTVTPGSLAISWTSGYAGTVTWSGATWEMTRFGVSCRYATNATKLGTLTGGLPATIDIEAAIPFHGGSSLCGSGTTSLTGSYKLTSPTSLFVDP